MKKTFYIFFSVLFITGCMKEDIYQWRGYNRDGIYNESNLLKEWPKDGPKLIWATDSILGNGFSSPIIKDDKIYLNGEIDSTCYLFVLDLDGNIIRKSPFGEEWTKYFPGSRSTPTLVGDLIYLSSSKGEIACLSAENGEKVWSVNILRNFHGVNTRFGYTESLLVDDEKIFCSPGGKDTNIVALDRFTGKTLWISNGTGEMSAFCSPMLVKMNKRKIVVNFSEHSVYGIDAETGEFLWSHDQDTLSDVHGNTPIYKDGHIYYTAGGGNMTVKLKLNDDGSAISEVWRCKKMDNVQGGVVLVDDKLIGTGHRIQKLWSLDINTGKLTDSLPVGRGCTIFADSMIYTYNDRGIMSLVKILPKFELAGSFKVEKGTKEHFAHPVISNGVLYIRRGKVLMAYDIRQKD